MGLVALGTLGTSSAFLVSRKVSNHNTPETQLPRLPIRLVPVPVLPHCRFRDLVPIEQLVDLLRRLVPCWFTIKTPVILHAFRLWGEHATFDIGLFPRPFAERLFTGDDLARFFLDDAFFRQVAPGEECLLHSTPYGVAARLDPATQLGSFVGPLAHQDDLLAACAETGMRSDTEVRTATSDATIRDMVLASAMTLAYDQELEWSLEALLRYTAPARRWPNRTGADVTLEEAVLWLLRKEIGVGPCIGTHSPYCLTVVHRMSRDFDLLSHPTLNAIEERLERVRDLLAQSQEVDGCWTGTWMSPSKIQPPVYSNRLGNAISATGHHLEWMALAPCSLTVDASAIHRAIEGSLALVLRLSPFEICDMYLPISHLARALCLLHGCDATHIVNLHCETATAN